MHSELTGKKNYTSCCCFYLVFFLSMFIISLNKRQEDKSSILFFKSKEFHMFLLVVERNLAKCRLPKGPNKILGTQG